MAVPLPSRILASITHEYWPYLGLAATRTRGDKWWLCYSQSRVLANREWVLTSIKYTRYSCPTMAAWHAALVSGGEGASRGQQRRASTAKPRTPASMRGQWRGAAHWRVMAQRAPHAVVFSRNKSATVQEPFAKCYGYPFWV